MPRISEREYFVPQSMDELRGPSSGVAEMPVWVYWGPSGGRFDAGSREDVLFAYPEILCEGTREDVTSLVNPDTLASVWGELLLPRTLRPKWEGRFPELAA